MQTGFTNMLGILQPGKIDDQGQSPESIRRGRMEDMKINPGNYTPGIRDGFLPGGVTPRGGSAIMDMRDRTLQDPYESGGMLGLATNDGLGGGALFLPDENRPRSEEDIRNRYEQAKAKAAEQRRNGFLGQVVLPGEMKYEDFKNMNNSFFLKRNPNIPESAYSNFDLTNIGGFDNLTDDASKKGLPETNEPPMFATTNPYNRVGQQLTGPNQDDILGTLKNIEQGIASLGQGGMDQSSFGGFNNNFGIGSFFPPYGGMYG